MLLNRIVASVTFFRFLICAFAFQVVIVPIWKKDDEKAGVLNAASSVKEVLQSAGLKVKFDDTDTRTPGWKFNFWEMKVPLFNLEFLFIIIVLPNE